MSEDTKVDIKVVMSSKFFDKITWFVRNYDKEVSGWIEGEINESIFLKDLLIPTQDVSSGSVDTDGKALVDLRKEYGDRCKNIIGHWHSHHSMSAFWSSTDETFIGEYMQGRDLRIFVVSSTTGHKVRVEVKKPFSISVDNLDFTIQHEDTKLSKELQKVIDDKCKETTTQTIVYGGQGVYGGFADKTGNTGWWDKRLDQTEQIIENQIKGMLSYDKQKMQVKIQDIYSEFGKELQELYKNFNVTRLPSNLGDVKETIIFNCKSKSETKRLYGELHEYLTATLESVEYGSYEQCFGGDYGSY